MSPIESHCSRARLRAVEANVLLDLYPTGGVRDVSELFCLDDFG